MSAPLDHVAAAKKYFTACSKSREYLGHKKKVLTLGWNCTGDRLASGSADKILRVLTMDSRGHVSKEMELVGHKSCINQVMFHPTHPDILGSTSEDHSVRIWDVKTGRQVTKVDTQGPIISMRWSPDGKYMAVGDKSDVISIIDTRKYKIIKTHKFPPLAYEYSFDPSGKYFLLALGNNTGNSVEIMEFPSLNRVRSIKGNRGHCYCIEFDPKGKYFATGGADALVSLWDVDDLVCVRTFPRLESPIRTLSFSHNGQFLASASRDHKIDISDVSSGRLVHSVSCSAEMNDIAWNPVHLLLAYAGDHTNNNKVSYGNMFVFGFPNNN